MKNTAAVINAALAAVVALGSLGLANDALAAEKQGEKRWCGQGWQERLPDRDQRLCGVYQTRCRAYGVHLRAQTHLRVDS